MMMNKWTTMKEQMAKPERGRRPFLSSECDNLQDAEMWRRDIIRETTKSVHLIQNAGAGEHKIRDLNDQINKLLRERTHWDKRILELGGPDFAANAPKSYDADGRELPGGGGYMYFGAAKDLPGVRELFHKSDVENPRRTRKDMYQYITPDYYGYRWAQRGRPAHWSHSIIPTGTLVFLCRWRLMYHGSAAVRDTTPYCIIRVQRHS